jgi:mRNA-degrading endonuclease toxin of MazEF toxin-antitoxin module
MVGKVYLADIIYTDMSSSKVRPILIIRRNSFGDFVYIPITSQDENVETLELDNIHFESGFIKKKSYLILDKLCSISAKLIDREIGKVTDEYFDTVLRKYCENLQNIISG